VNQRLYRSRDDRIIGGVAGGASCAARLRRLAIAPGGDGLGLFATYWHFLGLLWAYLLFVLFVL